MDVDDFFYDWDVDDCDVDLFCAEKVDPFRTPDGFGGDDEPPSADLGGSLRVNDGGDRGDDPTSAAILLATTALTALIAPTPMTTTTAMTSVTVTFASEATTTMPASVSAVPALTTWAEQISLFGDSMHGTVPLAGMAREAKGDDECDQD